MLPRVPLASWLPVAEVGLRLRCYELSRLASMELSAPVQPLCLLGARSYVGRLQYVDDNDIIYGAPKRGDEAGPKSAAREISFVHID